jgi:hypothetical protein
MLKILSLPDRIRDKIDPEPMSGCWIWTANRTHDGYGLTSPLLPGGSCYAHRVTYEILIGPIPAKMTLDHLCRITCCVNPEHLEPVTFAVNCARGFSRPAINARKTHCDRGHEFSLENTYIRKNHGGRRGCRKCNSIAVAKYKARSSRLREVA